MAAPTEGRCALFRGTTEPGRGAATYDVAGVKCRVVAEYEVDGHKLCSSCLFNTSIAYTKRWRRLGTLEWRTGLNIVVPDATLGRFV